MTKARFSYTLSALVQGLPNVRIQGNETCIITGIAPIQEAQKGDITFLTNSSYKKFLASTQASAVIISPSESGQYAFNAVITQDPYYIYSQIAAYFLPKKRTLSGVHQTAVIGERCQIAESAYIGPHVVIGNEVIIAHHAVIGAHSVIGDGVSIGENSKLDAHVTLYDGVTLGKRVYLASGVVVGSDGFGLASFQKRWHPIPQLGSVRLGDDVAVGANTTIDRGALHDTILEEGVKLDNLIQVGHNVSIGAHTAIAACVAIAGSAKIGCHCMIGGACNLAGHIELADHVVLTGMTTVTKSISAPGVYSSGVIGAVTNSEFRKNNAWFHRLGHLVERVKSLELMVKQLLVKRESI